MPLANVLRLKIEEQLQEEFSFTSKLSERKKKVIRQIGHMCIIYSKIDR
jgi:hypothetical protein